MSPAARVLVVSQVPAVRLLLQQTLEHRGCTAFAIEDCAAAAGLGDIDPPHLILLDEHSLRVEANAFQALVDAYPDAIVAALSAPVRRRGWTVPGVDCVVEKPVEERALLRTVAWSMQLQDPGDSGVGRARPIAS